MIDKERIEKITELITAHSKLKNEPNKADANVERAFEMLKPLSSKKRPTEIRCSHYTSMEYVVSKGIGTQDTHNSWSKIATEMDMWNFRRNFFKETDETIAKVAEFIPTKVKKDAFLKLCAKIKTLKHYGHISEEKLSITRKFQKAVPMYWFEESRWGGEGNHCTMLITGIKYSPQRIELLCKDLKESRSDTGVSKEPIQAITYILKIESILCLNTIERLYRPILECMVDWKRQADIMRAHDEAISVECMKVTCKFDLVKQL